MDPSALHPPFANLQVLRSFWSQYPEIETHLWNLYPIPTESGKPPGLSIDGENPASRHWALESFGYGIWRALATDDDNIYWWLTANIYGVDVRLWRAVYVADYPHLQKGALVPAHVLHPSGDPANLVPAILAAATKA